MLLIKVLFSVLHGLHDTHHFSSCPEEPIPDWRVAVVGSSLDARCVARAQTGRPN